MLLDPVKLFFILSGTLGLGCVGYLVAHGWAQRLMLFSFIVGLVLYSGIGAAAPEVAPIFIVYYFVFLVSVIIGFHFGRLLFLPLSLVAGDKLLPALRMMNRGYVWRTIIIFYVLLSAFPLIWPEFRLHQLFFPPSVDLYTSLLRRLSSTKPDALLKIVGYIHILITPFFYWSLYQLRHRLRWVLFIFILILYIQYIVDAYVSRGTIMIYLGYVFLALWLLHPRYRRRLVFLGFMVTPFMLLAFNWYSHARIGGEVNGSDIKSAIAAVLSVELGFVKNVGMPLWEAGSRVDLVKYFTWMATLPIPKIFIGAIDGARINYEISEIVLGKSIDERGFYVVLPGIVSESIYIYGPYFFWIHGLFIGIIAAFFARLAERVPQFLFLYLHVILIFSYKLNRGGIFAMLPPILNGFLLFYVFLLFMLFRCSARQGQRI